MSLEKLYLKKLKNSYGGTNTRAAKYLWGEYEGAECEPWYPKIRWPQLEELIEVLNGTSIPVAGGAVLGCLEAIEFGDIDIFPLKQDDIHRVGDILDNLGYRLKGEVSHSRLYEHESMVYRPVQVITVHTDVVDVYHLLRRFDLSCVQVAVMDGTLRTFHQTQVDLAERNLRVMSSLSVMSLLERIEK